VPFYPQAQSIMPSRVWMGLVQECNPAENTLTDLTSCLRYSPPKTFPLRSFPIAAMNIAKANTTVAVNAIADA
jgi:hypothetical protein